MLADDPQLTVRDADGPDGRAPAAAGRRSTAAAALPADRPGARRRRADPGQLAPPVPAALLAELFDRGVRRVLLEGGPTLAAAFLRAGLVDEVVVYLAPKLLGAGPAAGRRPGNQHDRPTRWTCTIAEVTRLGGDVALRLRPTRHTGGRQAADGRS